MKQQIAFAVSFWKVRTFLITVPYVKLNFIVVFCSNFFKHEMIEHPGNCMKYASF